MNTSPCDKHREAIALVAWNALDQAGHTALRSHLESCPSCRGHLEELQKLCGQVRQVATPSEAVALPGGFHSRLRTRIRADAGTVQSTAAAARESVPFLDRLLGWLKGPRFAMAGALAALLMGVGWWIGQKPATETPGMVSGAPAGASNVVRVAREPSMSRPSPAPTLMAMSRALNNSYENLDAFLARQEGLLAANDPPSRALAW